MAGRADRRGRIAARLFAGRVNDLGGVAHSHPDPRLALRRSFSGDMGMAALFLGDVARDHCCVHRELCPGPAGGGAAAGGHPAWVERMNTGVCLSCEAIERYLGEEEERVHALRGVSLDLESGSIHAVVGPSGCGKSTLLYILGLLDPPDTGQVAIESKSVSHLSDDELARTRNKFIGFIFQFHFLMEDFTAQENVMIPMRKLGQLSDNEMRERAAALLEAVGVGDKLRRPSRHLSGGEYHRVAIARALATLLPFTLPDDPRGQLGSGQPGRAGV